MAALSILWRRLDHPGHETVRLVRRGAQWHLAGTAVFVYDHRAGRLDYEVVCDSEWRTLAVGLAGCIRGEEVDIAIEVDAARVWRIEGLESASVAGCVDIDLGFSPCTSMLPIRRLALDIGQEAEVRTARLRLPKLDLEPLAQTYLRLDATTYRYTGDNGRFVRELRVNEDGFVVDYPTQWIEEK